MILAVVFPSGGMYTCSSQTIAHLSLSGAFGDQPCFLSPLSVISYYRFIFFPMGFVFPWVFTLVFTCSFICLSGRSFCSLNQRFLSMCHPVSVWWRVLGFWFCDHRIEEHLSLFAVVFETFSLCHFHFGSCSIFCCLSVWTEPNKHLQQKKKIKGISIKD